MAGYNRIIMIGNLTKDPEFKQISSGMGISRPYCRLSLASNRQFKNKQSGTVTQEVCYIDIDVWGAQAENCHQYLQKGRPVLVEGRLKLDSWKEADGQSRSKHSIVADHVVFLTTGQRTDAPAFDSLTASLTPDEAAVASPKRPVAHDKTSPQRSKGATLLTPDEYGSEGDTVSFKDEPPFEDDLPF